MVFRQNFARESQPAWDADGPIGRAIDVGKMVSVIQRQWRVVLFFLVIFLSFGIVYSTTLLSLFTATSVVLLESPKSTLIERISKEESAPLDDGAITSQIEVIKSDTVLLATVDRLKLADEGSFMVSYSSPISNLINQAKKVIDFSTDKAGITDPTEVAERKRRAALAILKTNAVVSRSGKSSTITVSFTSPFNGWAAKVSQGIVESYMLDRLEAKYDSTRDATIWLQQRLDDLKSRALDAELTVARFKTKNNLASSSGDLNSDLRLSRLNKDLIALKIETSKSRAQYERIQQFLDAGAPAYFASELLRGELSENIQKKFTNASKLEGEISARLGSNHLQAARLRREMQEYQQLLLNEARRLAESYKSEYLINKEKESSLSADIAIAVQESSNAAEAQVTLRELERTSDSYQRMYGIYLKTYQEANQQQNFPVTNARIISKAERPADPDNVGTNKILLLSAGLGFIFGVGFAGFREWRGSLAVDESSLVDELGIEFLGRIPRIEVQSTSKRRGKLDQKEIFFELSRDVLDQPFSRLSETHRGLKIALDQIGGGSANPKIVAVISVLPGEGKTVLASNFAHLLASTNSPTIFVDCDFRKPDATRYLMAQTDFGLADALSSDQLSTLSSGVDPISGLVWLAAAGKSRPVFPSSILGSGKMIRISSGLRQKYKYVVLDLPPISLTVDARVMSSQVDAFILAIEWGRTSRSAILASLQANPEIAKKCMGFVLTKAPNYEPGEWGDYLTVRDDR